VENVARVGRDADDTNIASQALISPVQCARCRNLMGQIDKKKNVIHFRRGWKRVGGGCRIEALGFISVESLLLGACSTTNGEEVGPFYLKLT
jgi:hypothetical protein